MSQLLDRETRLEAISLASAEDLIKLADSVLEDCAVAVSRGPSVGLLMVRAEDPSDRLPFNFTEVTVSEAEVFAQGERGYAMVMGRAPEKALAGAILDAALELGHRLSGSIEAYLAAALSEEEARIERELQLVAPTRVRFEEATP